MKQVLLAGGYAIPVVLGSLAPNGLPIFHVIGGGACIKEEHGYHSAKRKYCQSSPATLQLCFIQL